MLPTWFGLVTSNPPTPTRNPPCRARFALPWRRFAPSFALTGSRYRLHAFGGGYPLPKACRRQREPVRAKLGAKRRQGQSGAAAAGRIMGGGGWVVQLN